jgi:DnaA-homolog protein
VTPQLPLGLRFSQAPNFESFLGSADVVAVLKNTLQETFPHYLYLEGPSGSGKTHLLLACVAEARNLGRSVAYLPISVLAGRLQDALLQQDFDSIVCIDGVEAIAGNAEDEVALFHFHNRLIDSGKIIIYAAQRPPLALRLGLPDLQSRLGQCTRLTIAALDDADRRTVLLVRAAQRGLELDDAVLDFMFKRVGRDLLGLTTLLDKLDRESLAAQRKITIPFLKKNLGF